MGLSGNPLSLCPVLDQNGARLYRPLIFIHWAVYFLWRPLRGSTGGPLGLVFFGGGAGAR